jgi:hypothetical protein
MPNWMPLMYMVAAGFQRKINKGRTVRDLDGQMSFKVDSSIFKKEFNLKFLGYGSKK